MTRDQANELISLLDTNGDDARRYDGYSGRGMYGTKTCGVITTFLPDTVRSMAAMCNTNDRPLLADLDLRGDNLGLEYIVY